MSSTKIMLCSTTLNYQKFRQLVCSAIVPEMIGPSIKEPKQKVK